MEETPQHPGSAGPPFSPLPRQPGEPNKHHFVPKSYLKRWEESGQLQVTDVDTKVTYKTSAERAAKETDFYRIEHPDIDPNVIEPLAFENLLGKIETIAKLEIDELLERPPGIVDDRMTWEDLGYFIAFQVTRGREYRRTNQAMIADIYRNEALKVDDDEIRGEIDRSRRRSHCGSNG